MKKEFKDSVDLDVYKNDSEEAKEFEIRGSTNVFVNGESVPLEVALANDKMKAYLEERM